MCLFSNRVSDYPFVNQGKTRISDVNDSIVASLTDVSKVFAHPAYRERANCYQITYYNKNIKIHILARNWAKLAP